VVGGAECKIDGHRCLALLY
nr:RecName: Full=Thrombin-like enzyme gabonase; Short=SVTLE; AltName: Full=Fibrinogen-clotting enzyme; AltName: Full=Snake venom serine protease; Short=SVSP; AltName: Full=Venombin-AB [Bitis gabonica]